MRRKLKLTFIPDLQCQYNLMILGLLGSAVMYLLRVNLSVAIVAMVSHPQETEKKHFKESCPSNVLVEPKVIIIVKF